jgi:outer membrane murein-binding lipoprotein Lpp
MFRLRSGLARLTVVAGAVVLGGLSVSACSTSNYDQRLADANTRINAADAKAAAADQRADQALSAADAARNAAAQANDRLNALTAQVNGLQQAPPKTPRG